MCVPQENLDNSVRNLVGNKLKNIAATTGLSCVERASRYVLYPIIEEQDVQYTTTQPVMTIVSLQMTMYVVDYSDGIIFSSESFLLKGSGASKEKAYMSAVRNLRQNAKIDSCLSRARMKIAEYYNNSCDKMIVQANTLASLHKYDEAMSLLFQVPRESSCFGKAQEAIVAIYKVQDAQICSERISEARKYLARHAVKDALNQIALVLPESPCFEDAQTLYADAVAYVKECEEKLAIEKREIKEDAKKQKELELAKEKELMEMYVTLKKVELQTQSEKASQTDNQAIIDLALGMIQHGLASQSNAPVIDNRVLLKIANGY